jgi:hypothetical protein
MTQTPFHRKPDPTKVLLRAGLLLCGVALTWICVAFGLFWFTGPHCGTNKPRLARMRIAELRAAVMTYQIEVGRCPTTWDELIAGRYVSPRGIVDPWGVRFHLSCTADQERVTSAGRDRSFGTADDVTGD